MIPFTKMHGLGNDFVVIDNRQNNLNLNTKTIQQMANRHLGIGCDQILIVTAAPNENSDFGYQIFNADGTEVGQCGNGARCLAHFIHHHKISTKETLTLATITTNMQVTQTSKNNYCVTLPAPTFTPNNIPFITEHPNQPYPLSNQTTPCYVANVGNPHAIIITEELSNIDIEHQGSTISQHSQFPQQTNVSFMKIHTASKIELRTWERGAGETSACGSAACASMAIGHKFLDLEDEVEIILANGQLKVSWTGADAPMKLQGPSCLIYTGQWLE